MDITLADYEGVDEFYVQALLLAEVVKRVLDIKALHHAETTRCELVPIVDFRNRMRVSTIEKFDTSTYVGTVHFYADDAALDRKETLGTIVIYIEEEYVGDLIKRLDYPFENDDDPDELEIACGTICNLVAGNFKSGLMQLGYIPLAMSHFSAYRNEVISGVDYPVGQAKKYEIVFSINERRSMFVDLVMAPIPRVNTF